MTPNSGSGVPGFTGSGFRGSGVRVQVRGSGSGAAVRLSFCRFMQLIRLAVPGAAAVLLSGALSQVPSAQSSDPGTGVIAGRVVDSSTRGPVDDAVVTISGPAGYQRRVMVDESGRFAFGGLPTGTYQLQSDRFGFAPSGFGQPHPTASPRPIDLGQRQSRTDADIVMWKLAAIAGQLVDEQGDPVVKATVLAYHRQFDRGAPRLTGADVTPGSTDDRGRFRISGLLPGVYTLIVPNPVTTLPVAWLADYFNNYRAGMSSGGVTSELSRPEGARNARVGDLVVASRSYAAPLVEPPSLDSMLAFRTAYRGGTDLDLAESISLTAGEERVGVRIQVPIARGTRLSGRILDPDGSPIAALAVRLFTESGIVRPDDPDLAMATTLTDASGRFTFLGVPQGNYILRAGYVESEGVIGRGGLPWWVEQRVSHGDRENDALLIQAQPLPSIRGRLVAPGASDGTPGVVLWNVGGSMGRVVRPELDKNWQFSARLMPGAYTVTATSGGRPCLDVSLGSRNVGDAPIDIRDETREELVIGCMTMPARLGGTVRLPDGRPDTDAVVVLFPTDARQWAGVTVRMLRLRDVRTGRDGTFSVDVPHGDYFVVAIADESAYDWKDPTRLGKLAAGARRIQLGAAGPQTVDLVRIPVR